VNDSEIRPFEKGGLLWIHLKGDASLTSDRVAVVVDKVSTSVALRAVHIVWVHLRHEMIRTIPEVFLKSMYVTV
jgi:hypothetical protein